MKHQRRLAIGLAALGVALLLTPSIRAEAKNLTPTQKWSGSVEDLTLQKEAPKEGYITDAKAFEKLWKAWKTGEKKPEIDFKKEMVVVSTTRGGRLTLVAHLDDKGNLTIGGLATRDLRPGFRYAIAVISREGVKTVKGKELPKD